MNFDFQASLKKLIYQLSEVHDEHVFFVTLVVCAIIVLDDVLRVLKKNEAESGLSASKALHLRVDGSKRHASKTYISEVQGLSGRPDAVLLENGYFIPVERKTGGNKVRDRHIAQLLVYMRLVEEFEGKRPPYGYLILGRNARKVKIFNTEERQKWLTDILDQMRSVMAGKSPPTPKPHPQKCSRCKVAEYCPAAVRGSENSSIEIDDQHIVQLKRRTRST